MVKLCLVLFSLYSRAIVALLFPTCDQLIQGWTEVCFFLGIFWEFSALEKRQQKTGTIRAQHVGQKQQQQMHLRYHMIGVKTRQIMPGTIFISYVVLYFA